MKNLQILGIFVRDSGDFSNARGYRLDVLVLRAFLRDAPGEKRERIERQVETEAWQK